VEAVNGLESYAYQVKNTLGDDEKTGDKLTAEDKETAEKAVKETLSWLEENKSTATKEEADEQQKSLEKVIQPIMAKIYAGGAGGASGGASSEPQADHDEL